MTEPFIAEANDYLPGMRAQQKRDDAHRCMLNGFMNVNPAKLSLSQNLVTAVYTAHTEMSHVRQYNKTSPVVRNLIHS